MRDLATFLDGSRGIADFISGKILNEYGVFKRERAAEFFVRTLEQRQAVVMLDGLDEVPDDKQQDVLAAVIAFTCDLRQECPTGQAKILLTCRTQNFEMLRENWMAALGAQDALFALAPLRDSEIVSYLLKFKGLFKNADGPAKFMRSVREAKTLDLLRAPLILAIAVGLYAERPTMIPSTISELYHRMIEELLDRHAFRHERRPDESLLAYRRNDKYRFLREFALDAACKSGNFSDFTRADLELFGADLASHLDDVSDGKAMAAEVIEHSGLLSDAGRGGLWHYAHRSIQEFLAAEELRERGDGDPTLLDRANDLNWRQAVQFYTAGADARKVDDFLRQLADRNCELAGHCLQAARPSDEAARAVLDVLDPVTDSRLGALAAATRSPRVPVRTMAVERLRDAITHSRDVFMTASSSAGDLLPLLETIAGTNAAEIAALVPQIMRNLPDDPRLVGPLWQCLSADGIEQRQVCGEIVRRLLTMLTEPNAFAELERQDPHDRDFLTSFRPQAYPFKNARPRDHNLVTLLAWADYLNVSPGEPNRFFEAKIAGRLRNVESDRRWTLPLSLQGAARILSAIEITIGPAVGAAVLFTDPKLLLAPYGWWTLGIYLMLAAVPLAMLIALVMYAEDKESDSWVKRYLDTANDWEEGGNSYIYIINIFNLPDWLIAILTTILAALLTIAPGPLIARSLTVFIIVSAAINISFWATILNTFSKGRRYYLYRPNVYVDMYDDPRSRHWLVPGRRPGL
jgi:hypothetical protein